jgi:hypothetical protein
LGECAEKRVNFRISAVKVHSAALGRLLIREQISALRKITQVTVRRLDLIGYILGPAFATGRKTTAG